MAVNLARRLWTGQVELPAAFWGYMVAGGIAVNLVATAIAFSLFAAEAPAWLATVLLFGHAPYNLFMLMAVWRATGRWRGDPKWPALARPAALAWTALALVV